MSEGTQGFSLNENGWSAGCSPSSVLTSAPTKKSISFQKCGAFLCYYTAFCMCRSVCGQPCGTHSTEQRDATGKWSSMVETEQTGQCLDGWESWTGFEQGEEKDLSAPPPIYFDIWRALWCMRYGGAGLLQLTARNIRCAWNIFPHIVESLLWGHLGLQVINKYPPRDHDLWEVWTEVALNALAWLWGSALDPNQR